MSLHTRKDKAIILFAFLMAFMLGVGVVVTQIPPGPNTTEHGQGINYPTVTSTNGYFYGTPPVNVTGPLFGQFGLNDIYTLGSVGGTTYQIGALDVTDHLTSSLQETASYIISVSGGTYYLKSGTTGQTVTSSATVQTVFDAAVTAASSGEKIFIRAGDYQLTSWVISKTLTIEGESAEETGAGGTRIISTAANPVISVTANDVLLRNLRVSGFGSANPTCGIHITGLKCYLDNVKIENINAYPGIIIQGYSATFMNIKISNCKHGILMTQGATRPNDLRIISGILSSNIADFIGIDNQAGDTLVVLGLDITTTAANSSGIRINYGNSKCTLLGVRFEGTVGTNMVYGVNYVSGLGDYVAGLKFAYVATPINNPPSSSHIEGCYGYTTENIGTTTILNGTTSIVINHGLAYTPTSGNTAWTVTYLENPTNDPGSWYIDTFTATQATIHILRDPGISNLDIAWSARRTP